MAQLTRIRVRKNIRIGWALVLLATPLYFVGREYPQMEWAFNCVAISALFFLFVRGFAPLMLTEVVESSSEYFREKYLKSDEIGFVLFRKIMVVKDNDHG